MRLFGRRTRPADREEQFTDRVAAILAERGIAGVLDVGANRGGYGASLRRAGYSGSIVSFEPGAAAHAALVQTVGNDPAWIIAPRMALGEAPGEATLHGFNRDDMNSLLAVRDAAGDAFPALTPQGAETVPICRLDSVLDTVAPGLGASLLLKIDTQGSELAVLKGAAGIMPRIAALQVEIALSPIYAGQPRFAEVVAAADGLGFDPVLASQGFYAKRLRRQLDIDLLFLRR
jgi:FkbM family methyltransferase